MIVIAGAGSGKTRVLTYRVAYLIAEKKLSPDGIMAVTFTNKAAGEMFHRIINLVGKRRLHPWVATFHRTCANILRSYGDGEFFFNQYTVFDDSEQLAMIKRAMKKLEIEDKKYKPQSFLNRISRAKSNLVCCDKYEEDARDFMENLTASVYRVYQDGLRAQRGYDYDDLIMETCGLLRERDDVRELLRGYYHHILIDEFQDINPAQYEFVKLLVNPKEKNVFAVGDDDQSIYAFRCADPKYIDTFTRDYAPVKMIKLEQNYRSTSSILNLANEIIRLKSWGIMKKLWTNGPEGKKPSYFLGESDTDEAYYITKKIRDAVDNGESYNDFAVLYRTNAQSRSFEEVMGRLGVPYKIIGGLGFYQRMEIKDVLSYFRIIANDHDYQSLDRAINTPRRGIGDKSKEVIINMLEERKLGFFELEEYLDADFFLALPNALQRRLIEFLELMKDLRMKSSELSLLELLNYLLEKTKYEELLKLDDSIESDARLDNLNELRGAMASWSEEYPDEGLERYMQQVSLTANVDSYKETDEYVVLMTLHSAKGLEFNHVFIAGIEEGLLPHSRSQTPDEQEEERRLFYVGTTRAKKTLCLSSARHRRYMGESKPSTPSSFLLSIPDECVDGIGVLQTVSRREYFDVFPTRDDTRPIGKTRKREYDEYYGDDSPLPGEMFERMLEQKPKDKKKAVRINPSSFSIGDKVRHKFFGDGTVEEITASGEDNFLTINFPHIGRKILSEQAAPLNKIEE